MSVEGVAGRGRSAADLVALAAPGRVPTPEQAEVIGAGLGPTLVVAGAGSGKTETLALRMLYLLDHARDLFGEDVSPEEILCLTFTRKAASELAERSRRLLDLVFGPDPARPPASVATYNAYSAGVVREHGLRVGVDPDAEVLTDAGLWQLATRVVESWAGDLETSAAPGAVARAIPALAAALTEHGATPDDLAALGSVMAGEIGKLPGARGGPPPAGAREEAGRLRTRAEIAPVIAEFQRRKGEGGFLDFSDQIALAARLAEIPAVRAIERSRYRVVLLDEFQDTSFGQLDLFSAMFGERHPVMAVGDPHQAIYGFRGASGDSLGAFVERFGGRDRVRRLTLSVSWRNDAGVLAAANAVTASLRERAAIDVPPLRTRGEALGTPEPERPVPAVTARIYPDTASEVEGVVDELISRRRALADERDPSETVTAAVLCRRRSQFPDVAAALRARGVPFQVVGLGGLVDTPEVVDLVALLEAAHDPSRGDSLMRLLASDRIALGASDLAALGEWSEETAGPREDREAEPSLIDALGAPPPEGWVSPRGRSLGLAARARLADLSAAVSSVRSHAFLPVPELVAFATRRWGLDIECAATRPRADATRELEAFAEVARGFAARAARPTLGAFLAWLDAARREEGGLEAPVEDPDPEAIQVQTVHSAKGLEFDVVAVPGLVDGRFPDFGRPLAAGAAFADAGWLARLDALPWPLRRDAATLPELSWEGARTFREYEARRAEFREAAGARTLDEERRLLYVAVTRAFSSVVLGASWWGVGATPLRPSTFLSDLSEAGVVSVEGRDVRPDANPLAGRPGPTAPWPPPPTPREAVRRALAEEVRAAIADGSAVEGLPYEREVEAMLAERDARFSGASAVPAPAHVSATALVSLHRDRGDFALGLRRPLPTEPSPSAERGSAFHSWVERYFGRHALLDDGDLGPGESSDADLARLRGAFLASPWASRVPTHVEVDVEVPIGGVVLRSRIDAVFPPGGGLERATVVDWKSGSPPGDPEERRTREVQLAAYRLAWARWSGVSLEEVDAVFFYAATGETVAPERLLDGDEIAVLLAPDGGEIESA